MSWYLDGKDLSTLAWNVKERSAGWSVPGKSGDNVKVPGRHGAFWVPNKTYDEGRLTLSMWAAGCHEDGSMPHSEDGRKQVRDNLDHLTSLFSNSRRLLTLRQVTGDGAAMVNEISNPTLTTTANTGQNLAVDGLKDGSLVDTTPTEIARDAFTNPYVKGRDLEERVVTEDLYPDPLNHEIVNNPKQSLLRSYYYPIRQDWAGFNVFFNAINDFYWKTGYNGRGLIVAQKAVTYSGRAWIGELTRQVYADMPNKTTLYMQMKLGTAATTSSVPLKITPYASADGVTWTTGTAVTVNVTTASDWIVVGGDKLPTVSGAQDYWVKYGMEIPVASSWGAGVTHEVFRTAIQDSPLAGNPWVGYESTSQMIVGDTTPYASYSGGNGKSWSVFSRALAQPWTPVITSSRTTTSPYAYAWAHYDTNRKQNWLAFTAFGGTYQTFRRSLPAPIYNTGGARIWGKCISLTNKPTTIRVMQKISGTYTTVATTTTTGSTFTSPTFDIVRSADYVMEIDVPSSDSGMEPAIILLETHVSNGLVSTRFPGASEISKVWGSARAFYAGTQFKSTIVGRTYGTPRLVSGLPRYDAKADLSLTGSAWGAQGSGAFTEDGKLETIKTTFPTSITAKRLTFRSYMSLYAQSWVSGYSTIPTSITVPLTLTLYNAAGAVTRTVTQNFTGVSNQKANYYHTVTLNAGEVAASAKLTVDNSTNPFLGVVVERLQLMVNLPQGVNYFTGSEVNADPNWPKISSWAGSPYFSESVLSAPLPTQWSFEDLMGFDSSGAISFTGTKIRVQASLYSGNTYFGFRRGNYVGNQTITVQPEGAASATSLGSTTSSTEFVQGFATVPAGGATYVDFVVTGAGSYKTIRDAFAIGTWNPVFPIPSTSWVGFSANSPSTLSLPAHPSSQVPSTKIVRNLNGTTSFLTGVVPGWSGPILGGGYYPVPTGGTTLNVTSNSVAVTGGYVSAALRIQPTTEAIGRVTLELQGATDAGYLSNTWTTYAMKGITTSAYQELKLIDTVIGASKYVRLNIKAVNTNSAVTRTGVIAILDGATLTPSSIPLAGNFPGFFVGGRGPDGTSQYLGNIRQCYAEVVEAIDMVSTGLGTIAEFNVNLVVPDAFWEDSYDTSTTLTGTGTSGMFYASDFLGTTAPIMDTMVEVTPVSGTITSLTLVDKGTGQVFKYTGPAQSRIAINNDLFTVVGTTGTSLIQYISDTGSASLLPVTPYQRGEFENLGNHVDGTPVLEWACNVPIKLKITGRRKYLIA